MKARDFPLINIPTTGWKSSEPERINEEKQVAIAGTQVTCPKCKDVIGRLSVPIFSGMRIPADAIDFARHQIKHRNQKAECALCKEPYMKHFFSPTLHTRIHTPLGWV